MIYEYRGRLYPDYLKTGAACRFILPVAQQFCKGKGVDVGCFYWPMPDALPIDLRTGGDAMKLPEGPFDFVFSSHCLEHVEDPVAALEHWRDRLRPGGVLFLYLPHPDMEYWLPQNCRKHRHSWTPEQMEKLVRDLGFERVLCSQRDMAWSFSVVGFRPAPG